MNIKSCQRFSSNYKKEIGVNNILIYINLVKKGCPKNKALKFSIKKNCRYDISKTKDGPKNFKILDVKPKPLLSENGWSYMEPEYKIKDENVYTNNVLGKNKLIENINKTILKNSETKKELFNKKVIKMDEFYKKKINVKKIITNLNILKKKNKYKYKGKKLKSNTKKSENFRNNFNKLLSNYSKYLLSLLNKNVENNFKNDVGINFLKSKRLMADDFNKSIYVKRQSTIKKAKVTYNNELINDYLNKINLKTSTSSKNNIDKTNLNNLIDQVSNKINKINSKKLLSNKKFISKK